jgi:F0F1-type ATP synthase membrane subunit a
MSGTFLLLATSLSAFRYLLFKHGHAAYKGFKLEISGDNKGKIFAEDGSRPVDLSITKNVAAMFFSIALIFWIFLSVGKAYRKNPLKAPSGLQSFVEPIIVFLRDEVIKPAIGPKFFPYSFLYGSIICLGLSRYLRVELTLPET